MDNDDRRPETSWDPDAHYPQRPQVSQRTYWVRRIVALLILIIMIVVVVLGIKALVKAVTGTSEPKDPAAVTQTDTKAPDGDLTEKEPAKETEAEAETQPATDATGPQACTPQSIETVIAAGSTQFPVGATNQFSVVTKYLGTEACTLDVGAAARPVTVLIPDKCAPCYPIPQTEPHRRIRPLTASASCPTCVPSSTA